jgi:hypothetical protein
MQSHQRTTFTLDPIQAIVAILVIVMMCGGIPFTPFWVGVLILGTMCEAKMPI